MPAFSLKQRAAAKAAVLAFSVFVHDAQASDCADELWTMDSLMQHVPVNDASPAPGEIVVKLRNSDNDPAMILPFRDADILGLQESPDIGPGGALIYRLSFDVLLSSPSPEVLESEVRDVVEELRARPDVVFVAPNLTSASQHLKADCAPVPW